MIFEIDQLERTVLNDISTEVPKPFWSDLSHSPVSPGVKMNGLPLIIWPNIWRIERSTD